MLKLIVKLLIATAAYYFAWKITKMVDADYAPISILLVSWVCAFIFAPDVLNLFAWFKSMGEHSALDSLHGSCYVFDGHRFGFYLYEGIIWTPIKEIEAIIQPSISERELRLLGQEYGKIPEQKIIGITEAGILQLLKTRTQAKRAAPQMIRFKNWLSTHAFTNIRRLPSSSVDYKKGAEFSSDSE